MEDEEYHHYDTVENYEYGYYYTEPQSGHNYTQHEEDEEDDYYPGYENQDQGPVNIQPSRGRAQFRNANRESSYIYSTPP